MLLVRELALDLLAAPAREIARLLPGLLGQLLPLLLGLLRDPHRSGCLPQITLHGFFSFRWLSTTIYGPAHFGPELRQEGRFKRAVRTTLSTTLIHDQNRHPRDPIHPQSAFPLKTLCPSTPAHSEGRDHENPAPNPHLAVIA